MDPLALRDVIDTDDESSMRYTSAARRAERVVGIEKFGWARRKAPASDRGPIKRGLGVAQALWYRFVNMDSSCEVRIAKDGSVEILSGVQDIGSGIRTALAQVVAEELGLRASDIAVRIGDTAFPIGPASGGSVTTGSISPAARNAAFAAKKQLFAAVAGALGVSAADLDAKDGKVFAKNNPGQSLSFRAACAKIRTEQIAARTTRSDDYGGFAGKGRRGMGIGGYGGLQFAEVVVDTETGVIKVERVLAVHDLGRPLNPLAVESQINGGILQGISYALYENRILDRNTGLMVNPNLEQYKVLGARETPAIEVHLIEQYRARSSTDAGGIGEPATVPTAAAIANAVYNAIGARVRDLPMTPAKVLAAIAASKKEASR
jgi:xanthine dehydrogenase YagR molybdenum-binding subunit